MTTVAEGKKRRIDAQKAGDSDNPSLSPLQAAVSVNSKVSCLECRASKTKCSGGDICQRCQRLERECIYKEHRRGRFSDNKKVQHLENTVQTLMKELEEVHSRQGSSIGTPSSSRHDSSLADSSSQGRALKGGESYFGGKQGKASGDRLAGGEGGGRKGGATSSQTGSSQFEMQLPSHLDQIPPKSDYRLPMLSQPLELLAHASLQVRKDQQNTSDVLQYLPITGQRGGTRSIPGPARGEAFFSSGLCDNKEDHFDPIELGIISQQTAVHFFNIFMENLNEAINLLDPSLHSFGFVRGSSSFLLTAICWLTSLFDPKAGGIAIALDKHLMKTILPAVLMESYRSAEIAQAFILLAFYHPPSPTLSDDKSWQYIGHAARIASELGMNRLSQVSVERQKSEDFMRRVRNRERTWFNLWLGEMSIGEHMGRSPLLKVDPVIMSCNHWHTRDWAASADSLIVCTIQLRLQIGRQSESFDRMIMASQMDDTNDPQKNEARKVVVQFFFHNNALALDAWIRTWSLWFERDGRHGKSRLDKARLQYWYARVLLITKIIGLSDKLPDHQNIIQGLYSDAFSSSISYISLFLSSNVPEKLVWGHNSLIVAATYCCIFCTHVIMVMDHVEQRLGVDVDATIFLISQFVAALDLAGSVTEHRMGAATSYGPFLASVLARAKDKRTQELRGSAAANGSNVSMHSQQGTNQGEAEGNFSSHPSARYPYPSSSLPNTPSQNHNFSLYSKPPFMQQGTTVGGSNVGTSTMAPPPPQPYNPHDITYRSGMNSMDFQQFPSSGNIGMNNLSTGLPPNNNEMNPDAMWLPDSFRSYYADVPHGTNSTDVLDEAGLNNLIFGNTFNYQI
ncbi:hypothetical protein CBS101457_002725 [Exobasidium rhododendri]|nr:hypothetical protein CBS101457_002725 [Exobasidium rhododendri]